MQTMFTDRPLSLSMIKGGKIRVLAVAALRHPEMRAKLEELGIQPMPMAPAEFTDFVRSEQKLWSGVIKAANIRLDQ